MAEARQEDRWAHTSQLLAMIHNRIPGLPVSEMKNAGDFDPFTKRREAKKPVHREHISILKGFVLASQRQ